MFHHTGTCGNKSVHLLQCDIMLRSLCHAHTYPVATQKGVADLCLYQLQYRCKSSLAWPDPLLCRALSYTASDNALHGRGFSHTRLSQMHMHIGIKIFSLPGYRH